MYLCGYHLYHKLPVSWISNQEYKNVILELKEKQPISPIQIPEEVENILRNYQKEGIYWLYFIQKYNFGGILADEMGLGKTIQALSILAMNKGDNHIVVCPKSLIYNWENEIKKYFPQMKVLIIDNESDKRKDCIKNAKNYDVSITSYSMLQKDYREYIENNIEYNYMILDEAHYVKNMKTLSAKAVRVVPSKRKLLLTGTPLENNLEELYGTFDLVMPNYLGSMLDFRREFVSKIERNNMIALEILQSKIRPFILRRTKKEVLKELPDKQEQIVYNEMTNKQIIIYNEVLNRVKNEVNELIEKQGFDKSRIQVLSALLKLRQICNHPAILDQSFKNEEMICGKHEQFLELLEEVIDSGEKVLVFSQFTSMLDIFQNDLNSKKINFLRLDGSTKNRQEVVDQFNEDEKVKVFLISLKAGGVGLNLTAASAVFLYDPWWNPMAEQQAIDRAHRIGQKKTVNIYKFITKNSIEEKILKLQERKGNMFENLIAADNGFIKKLEWEDLMELFE
ncbi:DEAD/DEAH box helicase [bacterium]|nr:DEAD/DEAH box helicase [bacterium]